MKRRMISRKPSGANPDDFIFEITVDATGLFQMPFTSVGTYDVTIFWGDGTSNQITTWNDPNLLHDYGGPGAFVVTCRGTIVDFRMGGSYRTNWQNVLQWGNLVVGSGFRTFIGCSNLKISATDILNTSGCTTFNGFFENCTSLIDVPNIDQWDISSVTIMPSMFRSCTNFLGNGLENWDTKAVTDFGFMFFLARNFNADISGWDVSAAIKMNLTFHTAQSFNRDLSAWQTPSLTDMQATFQNSLINFDLSGWSVGLVTTMNATFQFLISFDQDLSAWDFTNVADFTNFLNGSKLSTPNYDALLVQLKATNTKTGITFNGGTSTFTIGSAADVARQSLIDDQGWIITDGGGV